MTPKEPIVEGWVENPEIAALVLEELELRRGDADEAESNARCWVKGPVRVLSSYVAGPGIPSAWVLTISRYGRRPDDRITSSVCRDFGMVRASEIQGVGTTQRGFIKYDDTANGFI